MGRCGAPSTPLFSISPASAWPWTLGAEPPVSPQWIGPTHVAKIATLAQWPSSPLFSDADRAVIAFAEQFVMDVGAMEETTRRPVADALGDNTVTFAQALYLVDMGLRLDTLLPASSASVARFCRSSRPKSPRTPICGPPSSQCQPRLGDCTESIRSPWSCRAFGSHGRTGAGSARLAGIYRPCSRWAATSASSTRSTTTSTATFRSATRSRCD